MRRDDAYKRVQSYAMQAWDEGIQFRDLISGGRRDHLERSVTKQAMDAVFDPGYYTQLRGRVVCSVRPVTNRVPS